MTAAAELSPALDMTTGREEESAAFSLGRPAQGWHPNLPDALGRPAPTVPLALLQQLRAVDVETYDAVRLCGHRFFKGACGCGRRPIVRTCKARLCPVCERTRATNAVDRYGPLFDGERWVRHLVLTARTVPVGQLEKGMRALRKAFRKLRHKIPRCFRGGVYSMEIKASRSTDGGWHPHIHALIVGDHLAKKFLDELWPQVTDGRGTITHISAVKTPEVDNLRHGLREALKYATKGAAGEPDSRDGHFTERWSRAMLREALVAMKSVRLFQKLGDFHGRKIAKKEAHVCETCERPVLVEVGGTLMTRAQAIEWQEGWYTPRDCGPFGKWDGTSARFRPSPAAS